MSCLLSALFLITNAICRTTAKEKSRRPAEVFSWQIRCAFNGFCKRALKNEAMNAHRDTKQRQLREVTFSDLPPEEENRLYVCDEYFADDEAEKSFVIGGKEITAKLLSEALHSLSDEKRETVLLYYFFDMSKREIATYCNIPRTPTLPPTPTA